MKKDVIINLKSVIEAEGETERFEIETRGSGFDGRDGFCFSYRETDDAGYEGSRICVRAGSERVTISRDGKAASQLIVEKGRRNVCSYSTPHGTTLLGITGGAISQKKKEDGTFDLYVCYELDVNTELISKNQLFINIRECADR